jgi:DNA-binding XRE family transcriptional regulator
VEPRPDGSLPSWPNGPFINLSAYPELQAHLRQVLMLARDAERFRKGRGMTRKDVARKAGLDVQTYGDFEAGRTWPVPSTLYRIAEALEIDMRLVAREIPPARPEPGSR